MSHTAQKSAPEREREKTNGFLSPERDRSTNQNSHSDSNSDCNSNSNSNSDRNSDRTEKGNKKRNKNGFPGTPPRWIRLLVWLAYSVFIVRLGLSFNPLSENLTGLAAAGREGELLGFCLSTGLIFFFFSLGERRIRSRPVLRLLLAVSCLSMILFPLIPWRADSPLLRDLHVWGCTAGFILYQCVWLAAFLLPQGSPSTWIFGPVDAASARIVGIQLLILAAGWLILCACGHISGLCELTYAFLEVSFLCLK